MISWVINLVEWVEQSITLITLKINILINSAQKINDPLQALLNDLLVGSGASYVIVVSAIIRTTRSVSMKGRRQRLVLLALVGLLDNAISSGNLPFIICCTLAIIRL